MEGLCGDTIGIIGSRLPPSTLSLLYSSTRTLSELVRSVKKESLFWKSTVENMVNLELPFVPRTEPVVYWSKLAQTLDAAGTYPESIIKLYPEGQYEFVYVAVKRRLETKDNTQHALYGAIEIQDVDSIRLILTESQFKHTLALPLVEAVNHKNESLKELLKYTTREESRKEERNLGTPLRVAILLGNDIGFKLLLNTYPLVDGEKDVVESILDDLASTQASNREDLLEVFLDSITSEDSTFVFDEKEHLSSYVGAIRSVPVTAREMQMLLDSDLYLIDVVFSFRKLSPDAAYLLYTLDRDHDINPEYHLKEDGTPTEYKISLLAIIVQDSNLLDKALEYAKPFVPNIIYRSALMVDNDAIQILHRHYLIQKAFVLREMSLVISSAFSVKALKDASLINNITIDDIEKIIMEAPVSFGTDSVKNIILLGVKLRRTHNSRWLIGQKLAFNCKLSELKHLYDAGFDFSSCGTDLLKHYASAHNEISTLLKYVQVFDNDIIYSAFARIPTIKSYILKNKIGEVSFKSNSIINTIGGFALSVMHKDTDAVIEYLEAGVSWKNMNNFSWLDNITPEIALHPKMKEGIVYLKKHFEDKILRDYQASNRLYNFTAWLKLARGLLGMVSVIEDEDSSIIAMGSIVVTIGYSVSSMGKYKGLDLFSDVGIPLTTKDDIRARRRTIQSTL